MTYNVLNGTLSNQPTSHLIIPVKLLQAYKFSCLKYIDAVDWAWDADTVPVIQITGSEFHIVFSDGVVGRQRGHVAHKIHWFPPVKRPRHGWTYTVPWVWLTQVYLDTCHKMLVLTNSARSNKMYSASLKKTCHSRHRHNFGKCWLIFTILSLLDLARNLQLNLCHVSHHTLHVLLRYTLWIVE